MKNVIIDIYLAYRNPHMLIFLKNVQGEHLFRKRVQGLGNSQILPEIVFMR